MDGDEKVGERGNKKEEFLGIKLKRGIFVGKKGGQSTPSPTWRLGLGLAQTDASPFHDFTFPSNFTRTISARQLAANLWEIEPNIVTVEMSKTAPLQQRHKHRDQGFKLSNLIDEPRDSSDDQPSAANNLRKHVMDPPMQRHQSIARAVDALQPTSPGGSSSMEMMAPYRPVIAPSRVKGRFRDSAYDLKTSTELLKVLNRIWSLEEQQHSNISLVKAMQKELNYARTQIKALLQEKKRNRQEMDHLMKQLVEANDCRRDKGQDQFREAIQSVRNELEDERKLRKHSESLHRKLARELSEVKSSFSNALKELERERKARMLLEDLCDEFAKGIRDYEQEIRVLKHKSEKDLSVGEHSDRLILHISEAWLDERMQMKLAEAGSGLQEKKTILDKLSFEIETFLQAKQSGCGGNSGFSTVKKPKDSTLQGSSLESFHLNEAGSAPKNGNDEEESFDSGLYGSKVDRDPSRNVSTNQHAEIAPRRNLRDTVISNRTRKRILSRMVKKDSGHSNLQAQFKENMQTDFSCNGCEGKPVDGEPVLTRTGNGVELKASESMFTDEVVQDGLLGRRDREMETQNELLNKLTGAGNSLEQSSSGAPASHVERWTSKEISKNPQAPDPSLRWHEGIIKENTLKAKLLEARLESRQSHSTRASRET